MPDRGPELSALLSGRTGIVSLEADALYTCDRAVQVRGSHDLTVLQNGASIVRAKPMPKNAHYGHAQIIITGSSGIRWDSGKVVGHKPPEQGYNRRVEGIHGVQIMSSTDIELAGWDIQNVWGDAFYIGGKKRKILGIDRLSRGIRISDSQGTEMGRHCVSVTGGDDIVVENNVFKRWHGNVRYSVEQPKKWKQIGIHLDAGNTYLKNG